MQASITGGDELSRIERVAHNRSGLWVAIVITIIGLLVFTGIFNFVIPGLGDNLSGTPLILLGMVLSLVPAAIWLFFFYRLDRLDPEPKQMVVRIFLMGALVAAALRDPLINGVFDVRAWQYNTWWGHLFGGILIVGVIEQFLIYATVRYVIFEHPEFDERVDGVIYAVAAGLGLATVLNFQYVIRSNGVDLDIGSVRMVINALGYASFAGVMGYFIGQTRFEKTPIYYMPGGLALAAVLNGLFWFLIDRTIGGGLRPNPWGDLIFAAIVAALTLALAFWLIERANEETLRVAHQKIREAIGMTPAPVPATVAPAAVATEASAAALGQESPAAPAATTSDAPAPAQSDNDGAESGTESGPTATPKENAE